MRSAKQPEGNLDFFLKVFKHLRVCQPNLKFFSGHYPDKSGHIWTFPDISKGSISPLLSPWTRLGRSSEPLGKQKARLKPCGVSAGRVLARKESVFRRLSPDTFTIPTLRRAAKRQWQ